MKWAQLWLSGVALVGSKSGGGGGGVRKGEGGKCSFSCSKRIISEGVVWALC